MALNPKMPSGQKTTAQTSRLPELIAGARTPLDILCALAEDGIACGFNLWAMATVWQDIPTITLCSIPPFLRRKPWNSFHILWLQLRKWIVKEIY